MSIDKPFTRRKFFGSLGVLFGSFGAAKAFLSRPKRRKISVDIEAVAKKRAFAGGSEPTYLASWDASVCRNRVHPFAPNRAALRYDKERRTIVDERVRVVTPEGHFRVATDAAGHVASWVRIEYCGSLPTRERYDEMLAAVGAGEMWPDGCRYRSRTFKDGDAIHLRDGRIARIDTTGHRREPNQYDRFFTSVPSPVQVCDGDAVALKEGGLGVIDFDGGSRPGPRGLLSTPGPRCRWNHGSQSWERLA